MNLRSRLRALKRRIVEAELRGGARDVARRRRYNRAARALRGGSRVLWQTLRRMRRELDDETVARLERFLTQLDVDDAGRVLPNGVTVYDAPRSSDFAAAYLFTPVHLDEMESMLDAPGVATLLLAQTSEGAIAVVGNDFFDVPEWRRVRAQRRPRDDREEADLADFSPEERARPSKRHHVAPAEPFFDEVRRPRVRHPKRELLEVEIFEEHDQRAPTPTKRARIAVGNR